MSAAVQKIVDQVSNGPLHSASKDSGLRVVTIYNFQPSRHCCVAVNEARKVLTRRAALHRGVAC